MFTISRRVSCLSAEGQQQLLLGKSWRWGEGALQKRKRLLLQKPNNLGWGDRCGNLPRVKGHVLANQAEQVLRGVEEVVELISRWAARPGHRGSGQCCLLQRQAVPPPSLALDYIMFQGTWTLVLKLRAFKMVRAEQ